MPGLARQHALQIGERGIEIVPPLLERRAQDQHRDRRLDKVPPGRQRRLGIAVVTRVALAASEREVGRCQRKRAVEVRGLFGQPRPRQRERTHRGSRAAGRRSRIASSSAGTNGSAEPAAGATASSRQASPKRAILITVCNLA